MCLRIGESKGRAPRSAKDNPAFDMQTQTEALNIGDKILYRILFKRCGRRRLPTTALVKKNGTKARPIDQTSIVRLDVSTGTTVQDDEWNAIIGPNLLPMHHMTAR